MLCTPKKKGHDNMGVLCAVLPSLCLGALSEVDIYCTAVAL